VRKVALRGIFEHKGRLIATFLAVALGVAFMGGVLVLADTMNATFDDLFGDIYKDTDAVVRSDTEIGASGADAFGGSDTRAQLSADLLEKVRDTDGVAEAEGNVQGYARIIDKDGDPVGDPAMGPPTFGANWTDSPDLNPFRIADGRAPEADDEIVIDKASADTTGYVPGDTVPVEARDGVKDYTLVGTARFGTADSPAGASFVLWTTPAAQELVGEPDRFQDIGVVADDGVSEDEVVASLRRSLEGDGVEVLTGTEITEETQSDIAQSLSFITRIFLVFAIIALVVGGFVIYNSFAIIVAQRTREMALLRAVGASNRQVRLAVLLEALVVGLTGSVVGVVLGLGLAALFGAFLQLPENALAILPGSVLLAVFTGVAVTVVSAYLPARRASRVPPLAAMREVAVDESGRSRIRLVAGIVVAAAGVALVVVGAVGSELQQVGIGVALAFAGLLLLGPGLARPVSRVLGAPLRALGVTGSLARQNVGRNPKRTSATAQALMIGVGVVAFFLVINASIRASIDEALDEGFAGDFVVSSGTFGMVGLPTSVAEQIGQLDDVETATPIRFAPAQVDGEDEAMAASNADVFDLFDLKIVQGDGDLRSGDVVVSEDSAKDDHPLGSTMTIKSVDQASGAVDCPHECEYTVAGVYETGASGGVGAPLIGLDDFDAAVPQPTDAQVIVKLKDGVSVAEAQPELERIVKPYVTAEVQNVDQFKDTFGDQLDGFLILVMAMLALSILIALLGIANTIALSVMERTREIGLLRAVGMSRRQLRSAIRWESVIVAVFGAVLGMAVGVLGGWGIITALSEEGFNAFTVPIGVMIGLLVLAVALGLLAAAVPAWRASRRDVLEAIATA
jgi:putative ABC transport system permease protein